jgi:hypothetical protein
MSILLPAHIQRRIDVERRREFEASILRNVTVEDARAREYTTLLQQIRPDMFMVKAHNTIWDNVPLRPGFYHILVRNQDAPMTVITVTDGGAYAEPDSRVFTQLGLMDQSERRVRDRLRQQEQEERDAIEKDRLEGQERRLQVAREVVLSATRAQVSMDRTIPWTQNSDGRRGGRT